MRTRFRLSSSVVRASALDRGLSAWILQEVSTRLLAAIKLRWSLRIWVTTRTGGPPVELVK